MEINLLESGFRSIRLLRVDIEKSTYLRSYPKLT